jgi:hypothetical protein
MTAKADELKERKSLAGSTTATTYHREAQIALGLENQGRFAHDPRSNSPPQVTGAEPFVRYPAASGPWNDPVQLGVEPPLNWSVEDQESVGTAVEVAASIAALEIAVSSPGETAMTGGEQPGLAPTGSASGFSLPFHSSGSPPTPSTTQTVIKRRKGL